MVLSTSLSVSPAVFDNKENVVFRFSQSVLRNTNGRRARSRANNTSSPVVITRESARGPRRRTQSVAPTRTPPRFPVEDVGTPSGSNGPQGIIQLPRTLGRPAFKAIPAGVLEAVDADLKGVALEYLHQKLQRFGPQLLAVAASTTANPPRDRLPRELQVIVNDITADAPSHLFAVCAQSQPPTRISLHPAHALVLASHCAHFPSLPYSKPAVAPAAGSTLTLPVVPLALPSPETFPILMHYFYTKRGDHLLASLLPIAPRDATQTLDQLSTEYAATFTVQALLARAARVHGLWSNVAALGVFDAKLWRGIEVVWAVLLDALAISTGSSWRTESPMSA
ncbi:hypothetical protein JB92DRAFT_1449636 [Gautieria morchelliformis]|nr:hypothetical protein JB92DRAFT_1449636 [Gautieria morchelliformis]